MPSAYIPVTITAKEGPVFLFETDAVVEVEYQTTNADGITGWHISNLKFEETKSEWKNGEWKQRKVAEFWADRAMMDVLTPYIDKRRLEDSLYDKLHDEGVIGRNGGPVSDLADYHARVL